MELVNFQMPGYRVNEYMLVIALPEDLRHKIMKVKEGFADKFRAPASRYLKPHLTLVQFITAEMMEEKLVQRLRTTGMGMAPFKIELKDYGSYPTHTIFVNVTTKAPVQNLIRQLKEAQRLMKLSNEHKPYFVDQPHIGIAGKLKPWQYEQAWAEFSHRQFTGRFIADHMLLLKKQVGEQAPFQIAGRFDFQNLPVLTKQGELFL